jgi:prevent-host-death family protein
MKSLTVHAGGQRGFHPGFRAGGPYHRDVARPPVGALSPRIAINSHVLQASKTAYPSGFKWLSIMAIIGNVKVSVAEAKNTLPKLIKAVEDGEPVTIYRHGTPVVDIVRTTKADPEKPKFGTLKGKVTALDPDWWKPMATNEVEAFLDGR